MNKSYFKTITHTKIIIFLTLSLLSPTTFSIVVEKIGDPSQLLFNSLFFSCMLLFVTTFNCCFAWDYIFYALKERKNLDESTTP